MEKLKAISSGPIILNLIDENNLDIVKDMFRGFADTEYMLAEIDESYKPRYDESGIRIKFGFYVLFNNELAGLTSLGIGSWKNLRGYTGADILSHMRGREIAPSSKPLLFHLAFDLLGLNRVETGCFVSNISSKKSIEKTPGFRLEGILREYTLGPGNKFEDEYRYAILKSDWLKIRENYDIRIIY
nr:GNAT family N-acetyltransferase [candidate division Zixibacteria bacterium]